MIKNRLRKNNQKGNTFVLIILLISIILAVFILTKITTTNKESNTQQINTQQPTDFISKNLHFSTKLPSGSTVEERFNRVTVIITGGQILIDRNGTNFDNLGDYIDDLDKKSESEIISDNVKNLNGYSSMERIVRFTTGEVQKSIIIYTDNWIYYISTITESLYDDLDQIAKSFKYIP